jgi:hypothetical protein
MANISALDRVGITLEELVEIYAKKQNLESTAAEVGISEKSVRKYLDLAGVKRFRGNRKARSREVPIWHYGCMGTWIRHNPTSRLPRSPREIARITGCTVDEVNMYLYRRRKELRAGLRDLPDLCSVRVVLDDSTGRRYPTMALERGYYSLNKYNFLIDYIALGKSGKTIRFRKSLEDWLEFFTLRGLL